MFKIIKNRVFIAVLLALIVMVLTYRLLISITEQVNIVVLTRELQAFEIVTEDAVDYRLISKADKATLFPSAIEDKNEIIGAIAKERIPEGTIIQRNNMFIIGDTAQKMIGVDNKVDPKYLIPEGYRLVAVNVDSEGATGKLIAKNDFVDVVYTSRDESTGGIYSRTILQQVSIFEIQANQDESAKSQNVVLLVKPEDVPMLVAAKRNGIIDLILNPSDTATFTDRPFHISDMAPVNVRDRDYSFDLIMADITANQYIPFEERNLLLGILTNLREDGSLKQSILYSNLPQEQKDQLIKILGLD